MNTFLKIIIAVLAFGLLNGCKTYRAIENVTVKNDQELSKTENLYRQLEQLSANEKIQVTLKNGRIYDLIYVSHSRDSLQSILEITPKSNKADKSSSPIAVPMEEIDRIHVLRTNYLILIGLPALGLITTLIIISTLDFGIDMSGLFVD
jgi:hypothetical protein